MADQFYTCGDKKITLTKCGKTKAFKIEGFSGSGVPSDVSFMEARRNPTNNGLDLGDGIFIVDINDGIGMSAMSAEDRTGLPDLNEREVFSFKGKERLILTEEFILKFKDEVTTVVINKFIRDNNYIKIKKLKLGKSVYVLKLKDYKNALDQINALKSNELVDFAQPNFKRLQNMQFVPDDFEFNKQWYLNGIHDINIVPAWDITRGNKDITIAIVDDGVDYTHEDLNVDGKLKPGYSAITDLDDPNPVNNDDYHGTFCAGIAAGAQNDKGISGVAPGCGLMGIKIAVSANKSWLTNDQLQAEGIQKAVDNNADVISNSWGGEADSPLVELAIKYAKTKGRGRKGCVVCFASGNYLEGHSDTNVLYPGRLSDVLTVGACNNFGEWKSFTSRDGISHWGSRYGNEVDLCAPGVFIATTDITGPRGKNGNGNYVYDFGGTSAATPIVAGVAALVLSVNDNLTATEVEEIMKLSTDRLYNGDYDKKTGYGRINAFKAVKLAEETLNINN